MGEITLERGARLYSVGPCASAPWWYWRIALNGSAIYSLCELSREEAVARICEITPLDEGDFARQLSIAAARPLGIGQREADNGRS